MQFKGQRDMHRWELEGLKVKGSYLGIDFIGVVLESRVKYGGSLSHWIKLDTPIVLPFVEAPHNTRDYVSITEHWDKDKNELLEIIG